MKAEIKNLMSNDTLDWEHWQPSDPTNVLHWFSLDIGPEGEIGADLFQVAVATHRGIAERKDKSRRFKGIVLDPFDKQKLEPLLRSFIGNISGNSWDDIVKEFRKTMLWEYE